MFCPSFLLTILCVLLVPQLCPTLSNPMDCSLPGSSVHGILQARILEWVSIPFSRGSFWSQDQIQVSHIASRFFTVWATREIPPTVKVLVTQSCLTLCNPMDCSPPGSSVHGILQAKIWSWYPFLSPGDLSSPGIKPRSPSLQILNHLSHQGSNSLSIYIF